jgi:hypothetical protein
MNRCFAEFLLIAEFVKHDIEVYKPVHDGCKADLIIVWQGKTIKFQVKTSAQSDEHKIEFGLKKKQPDGSSFNYKTQDIDYFVLYDINKTKFYVIPNNGTSSSITIRYNESRQAGVLAEDNLLSKFLENLINDKPTTKNIRAVRKQNNKIKSNVRFKNSESGFKGVNVNSRGKEYGFFARVYNKKLKINQYLEYGKDPRKLAIVYDEYVEKHYPGIFVTNKQLGLLR